MRPGSTNEPQERRRRQRARRRQDDTWRRTRRQRRRHALRHRRRLALIVGLIVLVLGLVAAGGITGAATIAPRCDLDGLRPVAIGQNSFVYAADGSLLGSIPAEKNRQPVPLNRIASGCGWGRSRSRTAGSTSTAASISRALRERWRPTSGRPGRRRRLDDHPAARPQPLHQPRGHVRAQADRSLHRRPAEQPPLEGMDPRELPEHRLLRQPRLWRPGRGADLLLEAGVEADSRAVGAACRADAGAVRLRPPEQVCFRAASPRPGAPGDARERRHHAAAVRRGGRRPPAAAEAGEGSTRESASRTSSASSATS